MNIIKEVWPQFRGESTPHDPFNPINVPEVARGYWWDPALTTNSGSTSFKIPEANGHSSFDFVQSTPATQPDTITVNNVSVLRYRPAADANPSKTATVSNVLAGWSGATYVAGWFRFPDVVSSFVGTNVLFNHSSVATLRRFTFTTLTTTIAAALSADGTTTTTRTWSNTIFHGGEFKWLEFIFDPSLTAIERLRLEINFVLQERQNSNTQSASLFDATASQMAWASRVAVATANTDKTDVGPLYYCNGIPKLSDRYNLANYHSPLSTVFSQ